MDTEPKYKYDVNDKKLMIINSKGITENIKNILLEKPKPVKQIRKRISIKTIIKLIKIKLIISMIITIIIKIIKIIKMIENNFNKFNILKQFHNNFFIFLFNFFIFKNYYQSFYHLYI